jgi:hypothetical protein
MQLAAQPLSTKTLLRVLVALVVILALLAGYYQTRYYIWRTNNTMILQKFNVYTTKELLEKKVEAR